MNNDVIVGVMVAVAVFFVVFLILRELMCWYWKINTIVSLLEGIQGSLQDLRGSMANGAASGSSSLGRAICPFCRELSLTSNPICEHCGKRKK
jgi:hypothetical protein